MRGLKFVILFFLLTVFLASAQKGRVLMVIAFENFRDEEYLIPRKIVENAGYKVVVASWQKGIAKGMLGERVKVDILVNEVKTEEFDGVIFVGGTGAENYFNNPYALKIAKEFYRSKKPTGAICLAPGILANAGILKGKRVTSWPSIKSLLERKGAIYTGEEVSVDGNLITGIGPKAAENFGKKFLSLLNTK